MCFCTYIRLYVCCIYTRPRIYYQFNQPTKKQNNNDIYSTTTNIQIRVVNAFRQGLDARYGEHSNTSLAEVLRKQTSLSKRLSQTSSIEYADNIPDELTIPEIDVERLSSHSHTETAV